jgi:DNA-binding NtrC family response regulator
MLLAVFAGDFVEEHPLPPSGRVTIGRSRSSDVRINHPSVSRHHAVIHLGPPLTIEDLGCTNGVVVRRHGASTTTQVTQPAQQLSSTIIELQAGDTVTLGTVALAIRHVTPSGQAAAGDEEAIVVRDAAMRDVHAQARLAARSTLSVLVLGETGVGKEVVARAIHDASPRVDKPFLGLNCAALPEALLESELFGHERGAFTGATAAKPGLFEVAAGGTVFLDEVAEMPLATQAKLLRAVAEREVLRVGARAPVAIDVRFIAATNHDLEAEAARGTFRQDLFFRLAGVTLMIPPLRERVVEIGPLARIFATQAFQKLDRKEAPSLSAEALASLERHTWPGNVRELRNVLERASVFCEGAVIEARHLPPRLAEAAATKAVPPSAPRPAASTPPADTRLKVDAEEERRRIVIVLEQCAGNQTQAASRLGVSRGTLIARMDAYGLPRPRKR